MDYYEFLKQSKPNNVKDFKDCLRYVFDYVGLWCYKKENDAKKINPNEGLLIEYFIRERNNILNSLNNWDHFYEMRFYHWGIDYDLEKFYEEIEKMFFNNKTNLSLNNDDFKELSKYFYQIEKSIWIAFYNAKIEDLKGGIKKVQTNSFNDLVFKDEPSERFFNYLVENWLKEEVNVITALRFIFTEMWFKNTEKEVSYKIKCTMPYFAREYWNKTYKDIKILNTKNPKLNDHNITSEYYSKRFSKHLNEFTGV